MKARAFWVVGRGQGELRQEALPEAGPGQVRVRALFSGISRGTESLVFHGRVPHSQYGAMRGPHQAGDFPWPVKYGYMMVGALPDDTPVFCLHPHQDHMIVGVDDVCPLPVGLPPARAVLAANMETALNAVWDAAPGPGDRVSVVGGGVVGCLVARLLGRFPGVSVELVDVNPDRAATAAALGVGFASPASAQPDRDLVIHASATSAGLATALSLAGVEATVLELSWYGDKAVSVPLGEAFHARRLVLKSSQVGRVPPHRRARWTYRRRLTAALDLLLDPVLDVLIDGESPFERLPDTMARLAAAPGALCHRIRYPGV